MDATKKVHRILLLILALVAGAFCDCEYPTQLDPSQTCFLQVHCSETISSVTLPKDCQGSTNYPVTVELIFTKAAEEFDEKIDDTELLPYVISLTVSGQWHKTNLNVLTFTPRLQKLSLTGNNIEEIIGQPFYDLDRLATIDLSYNKLKNIDELFQFELNPINIRTISLAHNRLEYIDGGVFCQLSSLVELDLSYNLFTDLRDEPFANLTMLRTLRLNNNKIKSLDGAMNTLFNLDHLFLSGNQIESIDTRSLKIIHELLTFDISMNQMQTLTPAVFTRHFDHFNKQTVCKIIVSGNQLTFLPDATSDMMVDNGSLIDLNVTTELDLSNNLISDIRYHAFQSVVKLTVLNLSHNKLINFYVNPKDLEHVKYLNMSVNFLKVIEFHSLTLMRNLQSLDLSYNYFEAISHMFELNTNLKYLNMTYNELRVVDSIGIDVFHNDGGAMDLSNNGLYKLHIPAKEGLHLRTLLIRANNITDVSLIDLSHHKDLVNIDISCNFITELNVNSFRLPAFMKFLNLTHNNINKITPRSFHRMGELETLLLGYNYIHEISFDVFQGLDDLEYLDLSFNDIQYLDSKVLMDLKKLKVLSLKNNGLQLFEYKSWVTHDGDLNVYLEGNEISCDWLSTVLRDYNKGYSKMKPFTLTPTTSSSSVAGISCKKDAENVVTPTVMVDERILVVLEKILAEIKKQNLFMNRYITYGPEVI